MLYKPFFLSLIASLFLLTSCSVEPKDIIYGTDACNFCKMTIVDKQHAAQYVTTKGKQFKFDAIECMVQDLANHDEEMAFELVASFGANGEMVAAAAATYLISEGIKSPMGANLSAFKSKETAMSTQKEHGGALYTWDQLKEKLAK